MAKLSKPHDYLRRLARHTGRNTLAYYSGFLQHGPVPGTEVNDLDKAGLMLAVEGLDPSKGLDLILHVHGGGIGTTESVVDFLRRSFADDLRTIVPQIATSAGTMIACSTREIVMGVQSSLSALDPYVQGFPALGVIEEFERAQREAEANPPRAAAWHPILAQYPPTLVDQCANAVAWSRYFVRQQLRAVMFKGDQEADAKADRIVDDLGTYKKDRTRDRHLHPTHCRGIGLKVAELEADPTMRDLVLGAHHCFMHELAAPGKLKMIESHLKSPK